MVLDCVSTRLNGPIITSKKIEISQIFAGGYGIIIQLNNQHSEFISRLVRFF